MLLLLLDLYQCLSWKSSSMTLGSFFVVSAVLGKLGELCVLAMAYNGQLSESRSVQSQMQPGSFSRQRVTKK